jgi:dTDP-4-amino-4,6-dideoxygalactose transaminase
MFCVLFPFDQLGITRQEFRRQLHERGIGTGMSYEALHLTTLAKSLGYHEGQYPNAERIARETVTLPLHCAMTLADVDRVFIAVTEILQSAK